MAVEIDLAPLRRPDLLAVLENMRPRDREEVFACRFTDDVPSLADEIMACQVAAVLCGLIRADDGVPVAYFGVYTRTPCAAECALIATDRWREVVRRFTKWVRELGIDRLVRAGITRVEARALDRHTDSQAWLTSLGARIECTIPRFGRNGEDFVQLAMTLEPDNADQESAHVFQPA